MGELRRRRGGLYPGLMNKAMLWARSNSISDFECGVICLATCWTDLHHPQTRLHSLDQIFYSTAHTRPSFVNGKHRARPHMKHTVSTFRSLSDCGDIIEILLHGCWTTSLDFARRPRSPRLRSLERSAQPIRIQMIYKIGIAIDTGSDE